MKRQVYIGSLAQERVGPIWVALSENGLIGVHMSAGEAAIRDYYAAYEVSVVEPAAAALCSQLSAYFRGELRAFDTPIDWGVMGDFQQRVLQQVVNIPYGQTRTYHEIAQQLDKPGAARAVGRANATNPMPLVIPCHRVLGADGKLHGYSGPGGVKTKAWLLQLEGSRLL